MEPRGLSRPVFPHGERTARSLGFTYFSTDTRRRKTIFGARSDLLLDEALDEYDVETKVGPIKFFHSNAHPDAVRYPFPELPERFDAHFAMLERRH